MDAIGLQPSWDVASIAVTGAISLVLIIISAMTSGSEVAFFSLSRTELDTLRGRSDSAAKRVLGLLDLLEPLRRFAFIHAIHHSNSLTQKQITIVAHAVRQRVLTLKEV